MIHWLWLIPTAIISSGISLILVALLTSSKCADCQAAAMANKKSEIWEE